jgi:tryptophan 2,3-dioxygenase
MSSDYERYIRTDELLSLQKALGEQVNHDEMLFQGTHQSAEIWMKIVLQDLTEAVRLLRVAAGEQLPSGVKEGAQSNRYPALPRATHLLLRCARIVNLLSQQVLILEMMSPADYHQIRLALGRGSGQDSPGFNQILKMAQPLTDAYTALFSAKGTDAVAIMTDPYANSEMHDLIQALMEVDEQFSRFRQHHLTLVRRQIGIDVMSLKGAPVERLIPNSQTFMFASLWDAVSVVTKSFNTTY